MADETDLKDLQNLMREVAKSTKSMADNMQVQTSRQEKLLLNEAAKEDAKRTEEFHKEQQEKLGKLNEFGEDQKSTEEQSLAIQQKMLDNQTKANKEQGNASYYLQTLAKLTQENKDTLKHLTDASVKSPGALGRGATKLAGVRDFFQVPGENRRTSPVGLLGDVAGIGSDLLALTKMGKEGLGNSLSGSNRRQKRIGINQKEIRDHKIALSAEKFKLEEAEKSGDKKGIKKYSSLIKDSEGALKELGTELSKDMTKEYLRQQKKKDSSYLRGFDSDTMSSIRSQQENNILASIMGDAQSSKSKALSGTIRPSKKNVPDKYSPGGNMTGSQFSKNAMNTAKGEGGTQSKYQANERQERRSEEMTEEFMTSSISPSDNPTNYGEYIASTYKQIEKLNEKLDDMTSNMKRISKQRKSDDGDDGGGFGLSSLLGGLMGSMGVGLASRFLGKRALTGMAKLAGGKKTKLGRFARNSKANKLKRERAKAQKAKAKIPSTKPVKVANASKGAASLVKGGSKVGGKTAAKVGGKTAAKVGGKALGKGLLKKIPIIGALAGLGFGAERIISDGDWAGGGLEVLSGLASTIPGLGTAASVGIDAGLAARDMGAFDSTTDAITDAPTPKLTQPKFKPQASEVDTSNVSQNKLAEYQMLSKMIANEMLRAQNSETGVQVAQQTANINANALSTALRT
jgi:hypothetical protein